VEQLTQELEATKASLRDETTGAGEKIESLRKHGEELQTALSEAQAVPSL